MSSKPKMRIIRQFKLYFRNNKILLGIITAGIIAFMSYNFQTEETLIVQDEKFIHLGMFMRTRDLELRNQIRKHLIPELIDNGFTFSFVIGKGSDYEKLFDEMHKFQDITFLDVKENINKGKTFAYFKKMHASFDGQHGMVFKMDTDTVVCPSKLKLMLRALDPMVDIYWGKENKRTETLTWASHQGGFYGVSTSLLKKIMKLMLQQDDLKGREDALMGKWAQKVNGDVSYLPGLEKNHHWLAQPFCHAVNNKDALDYYINKKESTQSFCSFTKEMVAKRKCD